MTVPLKRAPPANESPPLAPIPNGTVLKILGLCTLVLGFIELGVGAHTWAFVPNDRYGSWWAAMFVIIAGGIAVVATTKRHMEWLMFLASASTALCIGGMINDSLGFRTVNKVQACVNTDTDVVSGDATLGPYAVECQYSAGVNRLCACITAGPGYCQYFDISIYQNDNCDNIMTKYTDLILVSAVFTTFCLAFVSVLSLMSCAIYCKMPTPTPTEDRGADSPTFTEEPPRMRSLSKHEPDTEKDGEKDAEKRVVVLEDVPDDIL
mmetsp:Transcript_5123/g.11354  ORF Transcript_5123/g.11354 Transcript_5123/m.11354 type:complete len:265 (+) Transcript_5123:97-891(+)|eukprot:CAMPEP_0173184900 /NCGR_PEP_ID=MMETSP1141-20130122/9237_1 /TAXON_ID=483371 /ORGANISM="non described non described, Strain CCMP2298" /LENGTH=264 /DNA_ID=CAMNT_0014108331 /DNA_START=59 /DNA_END=853 /DNA_ORIENTATION=+